MQTPAANHSTLMESEIPFYLKQAPGIAPGGNKTLFYPSSGDDWLVPIRLFAPDITDFWFVDKRYFIAGVTAPATKRPPALATHPDYQFIDKTVVGPPSWPSSRKEIEPCILTEAYVHRPSGQVIRLHWRRGYGFSALRRQCELATLAVFFYRGDSLGEGGSGNLWLAPDHLAEILAKPIPGGLIVTDGSNPGRNNQEYAPLYALRHYSAADCLARGIAADQIGATLTHWAQPFRNRAGQSFTCVGFAGFRYGPTLIWRVGMEPEVPVRPRA
jgi:hypothetical protein